jgi:iron complex outermembrane receptor protein
VFAVFISSLVPCRKVSAQQDSAVTTLKPVVVTVTRGSGRTVLGSPFAISILEPDSSRPGQRHTSFDETISLIPGVASVNRSNPAQDPRLSIRGFGARSAFGVRGVRVLRDGIPVTLPDGQTPLDYVSLESVGRVEVLRGAASALYGNAGGGVVDLRSKPASMLPISGEARQWFGSSAFSRSVLSASGTSGAANYLGDISYTRSDGAREHSKQRAALGFARAGLRFKETDYSISLMGLDNPLAENPGALTLDEMETDREMADALSLRRNARKAVKQVQVALSSNRQMSNSEVALSAYGGARSVDNPLTFGVVEIGRHTWGGSGSLRTRNTIFGRLNSMAIGFDLQLQNDLRKNFAICTDTVVVTVPTATCPFPGLDRGIVTLDQRELVSSGGVYVTDDVPILPDVTMTVGIRADKVRFEVKDRLVGASNPDDSGIRTLGSVSPVAGIVARIAQTHSIYTNLSSAFETPTATELGNHEDGSAGLNANLDPQRSLTAEAGTKGWFGSILRYDASLFRTGVRDELIPFEIPSSNGRRYFRNAGRTVRKGAELGTELTLDPLTLTLAYTYSHFRFEKYTVAGQDLSTKFIPGIPAHRFQGAARFGSPSRFAIAEIEGTGKAWLDDANISRASGYWTTNARGGWALHAASMDLAVTIGIQNLFDRTYSSSIIVNAARGKFYEAAPRRMLFVGLSAGFQPGRSSSEHPAGFRRSGS